MDTIRESALIVDWEKNLLPHQGLELALVLCLSFFFLGQTCYQMNMCAACMCAHICVCVCVCVCACMCVCVCVCVCVLTSLGKMGGT